MSGEASPAIRAASARFSKVNWYSARRVSSSPLVSSESSAPAISERRIRTAPRRLWIFCKSVKTHLRKCRYVYFSTFTVSVATMAAHASYFFGVKTVFSVSFLEVTVSANYLEVLIPTTICRLGIRVAHGPFPCGPLCGKFSTPPVRRHPTSSTGVYSIAFGRCWLGGFSYLIPSPYRCRC